MTKKKTVESEKEIRYRYNPDKTIIAKVGDGEGGFVEKETHWIPIEEDEESE